ncbi:DNA mismatch repair protein [Niastella caeni]|uniref:DNA mismatch repair protein n=1 Tax=Niastella caeni TaxID=2569763 RepID=A0A4S8HL23_9BACT|nr:DNA mismatch repair protein [Niastella caeni]THU35988.1 DNA mismatch repair protein [Niastella caeni]
MLFETDKQTLDDLNIFGKPGSDSIYTLFNNTHTRGGAGILEQMFLYPLAGAAAINARSETIRFFAAGNMPFPLSSALFDSIELYLENDDERTRLSPEKETMAGKLQQLIATDHQYKLISNGIAAIAEVLQQLRSFINSISPAVTATAFAPVVQEMNELLADAGLEPLLQLKVKSKLSYAQTARFDDLLRFNKASVLRRLLFHLYHLDVYIAVAGIARKHDFVFPEATGNDQASLYLEEVYHPQVANAVPNTLHMTPGNNVVFLTGANMAGKSTFMKSLGIALYLAHMGFPVPARKMTFSVRNGIFTTINLADDLSMGNSHFYAEVLRLKKVAQEMVLSKNLFIIFDELFRGTNVKDAYEATIAITEAFATRRNCMFVVSTHIVEAGEVLKERCKGILFNYMPTTMRNNVPVYTYRLAPGITADRHGMVIINNEGILDIINNG